MDAKEAAAICRALGDENRLKIIEMLSTGEKCACKLLEKFEITQPTLSHHMKTLCESGLVSVRRDGKWCHYSLDRAKFAEFEEYTALFSRGGDDDGNGGCGCA